MRNTLRLALALALAGFAVSGCRYDHPGHDSDHPGHHHHHDGDGYR